MLQNSTQTVEQNNGSFLGLINLDPVYVIEKIREEEVYVCAHSDCNNSTKFFRNYLDMKQHWKNSHRFQVNYNCSYCCKNYFATEDEYMAHLEEHTISFNDNEENKQSKRERNNTSRDQRRDIRNIVYSDPVSPIPLPLSFSTHNECILPKKLTNFERQKQKHSFTTIELSQLNQKSKIIDNHIQR